MGKSKKKQNISDKIFEKKSKVVQKKVNPFEVKIQNEKFAILNRKSVHSIGRPSISRSRAIEKRKQTIGQEYQLAVNYKTNSFQDSRRNRGGGNSFGGYQPRKQNIYNLNDEVVLTHKGQTLAEIERYDGPAEEDDEMSDIETRLDDKFTKAAHFGGGDSSEDDESKPKDRKTAIEELIAESKKRKMEKLRENEEMFEKTKQLDNNWKDLLSIVNKMKKTNDDEDKPPADDFDKLVNSMIFEPRGVPTEKLKTEEEVAKQEKERLEKLERDRLSRMRGDEPEDNKPKHKSAEELDDFFFAMDPVTEDDESNRVISYEINPESEQNGQDQKIEESGSESESEVSEKGQEIDVKEKRSESESESAESESSADEEEEDDLEDLKHDSSSDEEIEETRTKPDNVLKISETIQTIKETIKENPKPPQKIYQEPTLTPEDTETLDKIPFTIQMPQQYEELLQMLTGKSTKIQDIIVERIIKTNHPQLLQVNRNKMLVLFAYLLQYINDLFTDIEPETAELHFKILEILMPHLYDLLKFNQFDASKCFQDVMKEKQETYKKRFKVFPKLDTIVYFKVAATLYPTSDYRHPIVTPMYVFINQILTHCRIKSKCDLTNGLFLCTLLLESQELSKRFLPSCMNFLYNVCYMGVRKSMADVMKPLPPLRKNPTFDSILVLQENVNDDFDLKVCGKDFVEEVIDEQFKLKSLNLAICLMQEFIELYADHTGVKYFIYPFLKVLSRLQDEEYFTIQVKENLENCVNFLEKLENEKKFVYPVQEKKHKMLRLMEPKLETVYSDRRLMYSSHQTGPKAEEKKLKRQVKREFKAAKRELRRDNEFVSKVQLKRRLESDRERKDKVKRIFNEASIQQSEFNALQRTKGRRNKF